MAPIATHTTVLRSRTWDQLKFEVEYARQHGTTANSYLIQADYTALIDPPGESFTTIFLETLQQHLRLTSLHYVILGHVNPNRMVTLKQLVEQAPHLTIVCSKPGANALKATFPDWEGRIRTVRGDESLDLGQGHVLQFTAVPTPRWADGLCTYDPATRLLYSDKLFGVHLCGDALVDEDWKALDADRRYYFDCLHASQSKQVEAALERIAAFPASCFAPGHGPLVRYSLSRLRYDYQQWCQQQKQQEFRVALLYASAYGNTATLAGAIAQGLLQGGVAIESINCELADPDEIAQAIETCDGFLIGSPTLGGHAPAQIQTALGIILSTATKTKLAGVFGSFGWSGEAVDILENKLRNADFRFGCEPIRVRFTPTSETLQRCEDAGAEFAQTLKKVKKQRVPRQVVLEAQTDRTEQAVGRIVGSLCVVSLQDNGTHRGFLTAWVSQATFHPPGLMVAIAADQVTDALIQPGTTFVLNILKEGRNLRRHFSRTYSSGETPFSELATQVATNGCLILSDALAYLECTVQNRMECGDGWLLYAGVDAGNVLDTNGMTAVYHRKAGTLV